VYAAVAGKMGNASEMHQHRVSTSPTTIA